MLWLSASCVHALRDGSMRTRLGPARILASLRARALPKVVFLGTPEVAAESLNTLAHAAKESGTFELCAVVTQPAQLLGRGSKRQLSPSPVAEAAGKLGIPVHTPERAKDEDFLAALEAIQPDLCVTAAYGQWLPHRFLAIPRCGTLNIHPSLLPRWRGASPVQRALQAGDTETGVSVLWTVAKMDAGPVAAVGRRALQGDEKAPELLQELFLRGTRLLIELLPAIWSGDCRPATSCQQDEACSMPADKISVGEAQVGLCQCWCWCWC